MALLTEFRAHTFPPFPRPLSCGLHQSPAPHATNRTHMCAGVNCFYPLCSLLRGSWRPGHPSYQTTSRESSIQRRRSCGVEQFAARHSYCINTLYFHLLTSQVDHFMPLPHRSLVLSKICSRLIYFSFISIINLISRSVCCMAPL